MNRPDQKKLVEDWNIRYPVGTPVRYWTGVREGEGKLSKTTHAAALLGGHTAVVWVEGEGGHIPLSLVEPERRCESCYLWGWGRYEGGDMRTCSASVPYRIDAPVLHASGGRHCDAYKPARTGECRPELPGRPVVACKTHECFNPAEKGCATCGGQLCEECCLWEKTRKAQQGPNEDKGR